ncbi:hypothetical protein Tco_1292218 [Tanacetum coccineum]
MAPAPYISDAGKISSGLCTNLWYMQHLMYPNNLQGGDLVLLFQSMFDEYLEPPRVERPVSSAPAVPVLVNSGGCSCPCGSSSIINKDNPFAHVDNNPFVNVFAPEPSSEASSSGDVSLAESTHVSQPHHHLGKWRRSLRFDYVFGKSPLDQYPPEIKLANDALCDACITLYCFQCEPKASNLP